MNVESNPAPGSPSAPAGAEFMPEPEPEVAAAALTPEEEQEAKAAAREALPLGPEHPEALEIRIRPTAQDTPNYFRVPWQRGPVGVAGINGVQAVDVLQETLRYLNAVNTYPFNNPETTAAVSKIEDAVAYLTGRTADREARGVEGTNQP